MAEGFRAQLAGMAGVFWVFGPFPWFGWAVLPLSLLVERAFSVLERNRIGFSVASDFVTCVIQYGSQSL